ELRLGVRIVIRDARSRMSLGYAQIGQQHRQWFVSLRWRGVLRLTHFDKSETVGKFPKQRTYAFRTTGFKELRSPHNQNVNFHEISPLLFSLRTETCSRRRNARWRISNG